MKRFAASGLTAGCLMMFLSIFPAIAAEKTASGTGRFQGPPDGWTTFVRGGAVHQFDTDMDSGGRFSSRRLYVQGGATYTWERRHSVSLALGYGHDHYGFTGAAGFGALAPWEDVHSVDVSMPVRYGLDRRWTVFAVPSLRFNGEDGAASGDAVTAGLLGGAAYRVSDRLTIGPGIGGVSQIEDPVDFFPILLIDWRITDTLSLTTGRGVGATLGPGLQLVWAPDRQWVLSLGGRYERLRFRLNKQGPEPEGVGEDRSFPLFGGITYRFNPSLQVSLLGGTELAGELLLEDRDGNLIRKTDYDPAGFVGGAISLRF
ncbi:MAG: TonB-dependent receptor [Pseudomonadota bacterium]